MNEERTEQLQNNSETEKQNATKKQNKFVSRAKALWNYFTVYEKIWYVTILVLAIVFACIFPEESPTQLLKLNNSAFSGEGEYTKLDFYGTTGIFVIDSLSIDGEEFAISDFCDVSSFTVDPSYPETLSLTLPKAVTKNSVVEMSCYQDSDDGEWTIAIVNDAGQKLFSETISLDEGEFGGYGVKDNAFLVSAAMITFLYVMDVVLNITCELLISKQSKWNFIVSLGVEIVEILICIVCMYRFSTMVTTLLFWIPCDIISFVMWHRHPDKRKEELTVVKKLTWWQDILIVAGIVVWTLGVGYLLTLLEVEGGIFANNVAYKNIACYIDACASAVGIVNGLLILFRYREQWIAWYICAALETAINIMAGQWVLLILKLGYFTNTTYGYVLWSKYIRGAEREKTVSAAQTQPN